ncbi:MAG: hypothetical protein IPH93_04525 [Saprospiraceae bacterium]|nr:hypothetical protein [Saprospiraceae bacterium]MBK7811763.1 hypothetical protein [Saprospiraceae bacterium]MBK9631771.1 hypothetical protein [Saprospiraceae bacterium]
MNKYSLILITLMILSCNIPEDPVEEVYFHGSAKIPINNDTLEFMQSLKLSHNTLDTFNIAFVYFIGDNIQRKILSIAGFSLSFAKQNLFISEFDFDINDKPFSSFATSLSDGDVAGNYYKLNTNDSIEDYIQINEYNSTTKMVKGNVQASYIIHLLPGDIKFDLTSPDTIIISNFEFETKILER